MFDSEYLVRNRNLSITSTAMTLRLVMLVVLVSAQDNNLEISGEACPVQGRCPDKKCCTDYECEKQDDYGRKIQCCNTAELIAEQQIPLESRACSPCLKCREY